MTHTPGTAGTGAPWLQLYLLVLGAPPLLLPAHLLLIVAALLSLLLLAHLLLSPLLLWGNKQTTMKERGTGGGGLSGNQLGKLKNCRREFSRRDVCTPEGSLPSDYWGRHSEDGSCRTPCHLPCKWTLQVYVSQEVQCVLPVG